MLKCCDRCFEFLSRKNAASASLWAELCDEYDIPTYFSCHADCSEIFRLLEHENYIVSTEAENPNYLRVKLLGIGPESSFVCVSPDTHY